MIIGFVKPLGGWWSIIMENDLAAVKKFIYMIEGHKDRDSFTIFDSELPAVSLESAQALCNKWHIMNPEITYLPVLFFKSAYC